MKVKIFAKQRLEAAKKCKSKKNELTPWLKKVIRDGRKDWVTGNVTVISLKQALKEIDRM